MEPTTVKLSEQILTYDWQVMFYRGASEPEIVANCNALFVVNLSGVGGSVIRVNEFPLNPALVAGANGEVFTIGGNRGEIISRKQLNIGVGVGNVLYAVIQKFYTNLC